jgi:hypothetical protein
VIAYSGKSTRKQVSRYSIPDLKQKTLSTRKPQMSSSLPLDVLTKYKTTSRIFFETGTFNGETVTTAMEAGFEDIFSVDISEEKYAKNVIKFRNWPHVHLFLGDSVEALRTVLRLIDDPVVFWLDAHPMPKTGPAFTPLLNELQAIADWGKPCTILADDMRLVGTEYWTIKMDKVISSIQKINQHFTIVREDNDHKKKDIIVAYGGKWE